MTQYGVNAHFKLEELKQIETAARKLGISKYKLMRNAVLKYCEECLKNVGEERGRIPEQNQPNIRDSTSERQGEKGIPEGVLERILGKTSTLES